MFSDKTADCASGKQLSAEQFAMYKPTTKNLTLKNDDISLSTFSLSIRQLLSADDFILNTTLIKKSQELKRNALIPPVFSIGR
jgi:hypothetical protein